MKITINGGHCPGLDSGATNPITGLQEAFVVKDIGTQVCDFLRAVGYVTLFVQENDEIVLGDVYLNHFNRLLMRHYNRGIRGTAGKAANNNKFTCLNFYDGNADGTAIPIYDAYMGENVFEECNFEGSLIQEVDFSVGGGFNTLINCRWERMQSGTTWLKLGNGNILINPLFAQNTTQHSYPNPMIYVTGSNNKITKISSNIPRSLIKLETTSSENIVQIDISQSYDEVNPDFEMPVQDLGINNQIWFGNNDVTINNAITKSTRAVTNYLLNSMDFSSLTLDGLLKTSMDGLNIGRGVLNDGHCYHLHTPTDQRKAYWIVTNLTSGYYYTFSFFVRAFNGTTDDFQVIAGSDSTALSNNYYRAINRFVRYTRSFKAVGTSAYFGFRLMESSGGIVVTQPQVSESNLVSGKHEVFPGGYVPTVGAIRTDYAPAYDRKNRVAPTIPTGGKNDIGDTIKNLVPVSGQPSGWICTAPGEPGTLKGYGVIL